MSINLPILSFNSGLLSALIDARSDVEKYGSGCRILQNFIPLLYGPVTRRPGTKFIATTKDNGVAYLIPFFFSSEIAYQCEFGDEYARFYFDGERLEVDGIPVEISTPYDIGDVPRIQRKQLADTMWLVHTDYAPYKLTRTTATTFSIDKIIITGGPYLLRNDLAEDNDVTVACSVTDVDATGTLTASEATFEAGHVDSLWQLLIPRDVAEVTQKGVGTSDVLDIKGTYSFVTSGAWKGTVVLQRNQDGKGWEDFRTWTGLTTGAKNIRLDKVETETVVQFRILAKAGMSVNFGASLQVFENLREGIVRIDSLTSSTVANVTVLQELENTDAVVRWAEGAWNGVQGFPAAVGFIENRIVYAGTPSEPQAVWFSAVDDYEIFEAGTNDANSFKATLLTTNAIRWLDALDALIIGTSGDEWQISSNRLYTPITPINSFPKRQTTRGSTELQSIRVNESILFVNKTGRKIRELVFSDTDQRFVSPDMTALAESITKTGIVSWAVQKNPETIVWCVLGNGNLLSLTFEKEQNVVAWATHRIGSGNAESVSVIPGIPEDEISLVVQRTVLGNTVRYIEQIQPRDFGDLEDAWFVDSGIIAETPEAIRVGYIGYNIRYGDAVYGLGPYGGVL